MNRKKMIVVTATVIAVAVVACGFWCDMNGIAGPEDVYRARATCSPISH